MEGEDILKENIVQIGNHRYRYAYDPNGQQTRYLGPVGQAPDLTESEFFSLLEESKKVEMRPDCPACGSEDYVIEGEVLVWCPKCKKRYPIEQFQVQEFVFDPSKKFYITPYQRNFFHSRLIDLGINKEYHYSIPIGTIFEQLEKVRIIPLQEDNTPWVGMLLGREGKAVLNLAYQGPEGVYNPVKNSMLVITWYKHETGRYEVNTYLS